MKKLLLLTFIFTAFTMNAQEGPSVKFGLNSSTLSGEGDSESESGFYIGLGYEFELGGDINFEPAVTYALVDDFEALNIPLLFKYGVSDEFSLLAGPQIMYLLEDVDDAAFGLDLAFGLSYDINDDFYLETRYGFQVSRDSGDAKLNTFNLGIGYRF